MSDIAPSASFLLALFDESLPDHVAFKKVRSNILDAAIASNRTHTANFLGMAHQAVNPQDHLDILQAPAAPIADPGDYVDGTPAEMKNQEKGMKRYELQEKLNPSLRSAALAILPARIIRLAEVNGSTRHHLHLYDILDEIEAKLPMTEADVMSCRERVSKPYVRGTLIRPFVADQLAHLQYLTDAGQAMANMDAVKLMKVAYLSTQIDRADFAPALTEYVREHGSLAAQTPASWGEFIVDFVDERLVAHAEANSARRKGQAFAAASAIPASVPSTEEDDEEQGKDYAAFLAFKKTAAKAKALPPSSTGPKQKRMRLYCWTHGCQGHASGGKFRPCNKPGEGHKYEATFDNQMGGKFEK
jgi:hypothetical protein